MYQHQAYTNPSSQRVHSTLQPAASSRVATVPTWPGSTQQTPATAESSSIDVTQQNGLQTASPSRARAWIHVNACFARAAYPQIPLTVSGCDSARFRCAKTVLKQRLHLRKKFPTPDVKSPDPKREAGLRHSLCRTKILPI